MEGPERVVYTESHDEVANGRTRVPAEIDSDDPASVWAFRRSALGAVLMMTAVGVPMLFQGQEWAEEDWFDDARDLRWERRNARPGVVAMWRDLIHLRTGADPRAHGLSGDRISVHRPADAPEVVTFWRWGLGGEHAAAVVVVNFHNVDREVQVPVPGPGDWKCVFASDWSGYHSSGSDLISGAPVEEPEQGQAALRLTMPCYGAAIFSLSE